MIDKGDLEAPLRQSFIQQISQPLEGWRIQIDHLIAQRQPFHLVYQNSQGHPLEYTLITSSIRSPRKRSYIEELQY